jgi:hypothetical protein
MFWTCHAREPSEPIPDNLTHLRSHSPQIHSYLLQSSAGVGAEALALTDMWDSILAHSSSLLGLVRNPFLLRLFVEALPAMSPREREHITRYSIYRR